MVFAESVWNPGLIAAICAGLVSIFSAVVAWLSTRKSKDNNSKLIELTKTLADLTGEKALKTKDAVDISEAKAALNEYIKSLGITPAQVAPVVPAPAPIIAVAPIA